MIYQGDCLNILPTLDAESVQLDTDVVQFFAPQVKGIALGNVFIGERFVGNAADCAMRIREVSKTSYLRSVFCPLRTAH